jgi:ABC-type transport system involved in multi-copper enzyme maturation permease subunit
LNTDLCEERSPRRASWRALVGKAWGESRNRFFASLASLLILVGYSVLTGPQFLEGMAINHPDEPLPYSGYIWMILFDFYLQGFWIACAFILGLGGLGRERATGVSPYTLSLPVTRKDLVLIRVAVAIVESFVIALVPCLLIPMFSWATGNHYPLAQSVTFALFLAVGGLVFVGLSVLLSSLFEGEYSAFVLGMGAIATAFFAFKARSIHRWSIFDVMSGARHIDRTTHLVASVPWLGLTISILISILLLSASVQITRSRDF